MERNLKIFVFTFCELIENGATEYKKKLKEKNLTIDGLKSSFE